MPAFELLLCLFTVFAILFLLQTVQQAKPQLISPGVYEVTQKAPNKNPDDIDLYVQDPNGNIVYFNNKDAGLMNLNHDVIPGATEGNGTALKGSPCDCEQIVLRGVVAGEYIVNVHCYDCKSLPVKAKIQLVNLRGVRYERTVSLYREGQAVTAFRFTLSAAGSLTNINTLPRNIVYVSQYGS